MEKALTEGYSPGDARKPSVVLSSATLGAIAESLEVKFGPHFLLMPARDRYSLIDEARVLAEREGDREVYIYHHGFYRGMIIASIILLIGFTLRFFVGRSCIEVSGNSYCAGRFDFFAASVITAASVYGFWLRLKRFAEYRLVRAVMLWLAIMKFSETKKSG
jgi:hypothetical protein